MPIPLGTPMDENPSDAEPVVVFTATYGIWAVVNRSISRRRCIGRRPWSNENPNRGPVLVTLEYRIDPTRRQEFLALMQQLGETRRRDGAFMWGLFHDAAAADHFLECFMAESWLEHLRQHERVTVADRALQEQIDQCLLEPGGPRVFHYLASGV